MNNIFIEVRKITSIINLRKNKNNIISADVDIDDDFYYIDNIIRNNESCEKIKDFNKVLDIMKSFISNSRYTDFNTYFTYFIKNKKSDLEYTNFIDKCIKIISGLNVDIISDNFPMISYNLVSNFTKIDIFIKKYNTFDMWKNIISDSVSEIIKSNDKEFEYKIKNIYLTLLNKYNEIFGKIDNDFEFFTFIFNSIVYYIDSNNMMSILSDKIERIFSILLYVSYNNFIRGDISSIINNEYIYINKDIISNFDTIYNDILNKSINYDSTLDSLNHYTELSNFSFEDLKSCKYTLKSCIKYLNNIIIQTKESDLICNKLRNFVDKIINSKEIEDNKKSFLFTFYDEMNINISQNSVYYKFINSFMISYNVLNYKYNKVSLFKNLSNSNKNLTNLSLVDYCKNRFSKINLISNEFILNSKNNDIIPLVIKDKYATFNIVEYINDDGRVIIPFAYSNEFDSDIKVIIDNNNYSIVKYNYIYYIIDNVYNVNESDVNILRNLGVEYSLISPNLMILESLVYVISGLNELPLSEASKLENKLKIWKDTLKLKINQAKDSEVKISNEIDNAASKLQDDIKYAFTSKNREAIIKGRLIPSLSQLIKLILATGAISFFINPLTGALSFLGALAISSKATKEERKVILDEIDVKIKVIDKKISKAEADDDMKSYEDYLKVKKVLELEKKKILYKIDDYSKLDSHKDDD